MHPVFFALIGYVGLMLVATFLGWLFCIALIVADLTRQHPVAMAKASLALAGCIFTLALFISGDLLLGCLGVILSGIWLVLSSKRRHG